MLHGSFLPPSPAADFAGREPGQHSGQRDCQQGFGSWRHGSNGAYFVPFRQISGCGLWAFMGFGTTCAAVLVAPESLKPPKKNKQQKAPSAGCLSFRW